MNILFRNQLLKVRLRFDEARYIVRRTLFYRGDD